MPSPRERLSLAQDRARRRWTGMEPFEDPADELLPCPLCDGDPDCELCQGAGEATGEALAEHYGLEWDPGDE